MPLLINYVMRTIRTGTKNSEFPVLNTSKVTLSLPKKKKKKSVIQNKIATKRLKDYTMFYLSISKWHYCSIDLDHLNPKIKCTAEEKAWMRLY